MSFRCKLIGLFRNNADSLILDGKKVDVEEMEAILDQIMTDEFNALLEDDSPYLVLFPISLLSLSMTQETGRNNSHMT